MFGNVGIKKKSVLGVIMKVDTKEATYLISP